MKKILYSGLALGLLLAATPIALADTYIFTFTGTGISLGADTFYSDTITGVSGWATVDSNFQDREDVEADNVFWTWEIGYPYYGSGVDGDGFLFSISDGAYVHLFCGGEYGEFGVPSGLFSCGINEYPNYASLCYPFCPAGTPAPSPFFESGVIFTITDLTTDTAPEPAPWLLLGSGLLALLGVAYRRGKVPIAASNLRSSFESPAALTGPRGT